MPDFDFAIHGTGLLSALLAGLLARDGKRVVRIGMAPSSQRLPRALDLALPLSVHPANWRMVRAGEAETHALLVELGAAAGWSESTVEIVADTRARAAELDHVAHLAHGFGHQVGRLPGGWALRRVAQLRPESLVGKITEWLARTDVASRDVGPADAARTILADDAAILSFWGEDRRPAVLRGEAMTASLLVSPGPLAAPVRLFPDRGVTLQRRPGNMMLALVSGEHDVDARLASALPGPFPMKRLATTRYRRLASADSAPLVGAIGDAFVIAGLGDPAVFLAPALARLLGGTASADEAAWFAARDPSSAARVSLADIGGMP